MSVCLSILTKTFKQQTKSSFIIGIHWICINGSKKCWLFAPQQRTIYFRLLAEFNIKIEPTTKINWGYLVHKISVLYLSIFRQDLKKLVEVNVFKNGREYDWKGINNNIYVCVVNVFILFREKIIKHTYTHTHTYVISLTLSNISFHFPTLSPYFFFVERQHPSLLWRHSFIICCNVISITTFPFQQSPIGPKQ